MERQRYLVPILLALVLASSLTSLHSYSTTRSWVEDDMDRALALTMREQQSDVISQDTIRTFNSYLQIEALRGHATIAVDTRNKGFRAYARCSEATILGLSDQRPAMVLWAMTLTWSLFLWSRRRQAAAVQRQIGSAQRQAAAAPAPLAETAVGFHYGGITLSNDRFMDADGNDIRLTPMQHQLLTLFFHSPRHQLTKAEICDALWPKKPDASDTLYTLVKRLKPAIEPHSLKIEADRGRSYRLILS